MSIFTIKTPSGRELDIEAPDAETARRGARDWEQKQNQSQEPGRAGEAAKRGFLRGASFDFLDELSGLAKAGGLDPNDPDVAHAVKSLFVGGYRKFKGDPEAEQLYQEEVDRQRKLSQALEEQHPGATIAGQLGGGLALPFGAAARTATMGGRAIAAAKTGAVVGGLTGFGAGEGLQGSAIGAGIGAPLGAATGAALSPVTELGVQAVTRGVQRPYNAVRDALDPERGAARRIGIAAERDRRVGDLGLSDAEYQAAQAAGMPVAAVDQLGTTGRFLARSAADTSAEANAALNRATQDRFTSQGPRTASFVRETNSYPNVEAQQAAIAETQRAGNSVAYRRAYAEGAGGVGSPELERLAGTDAVGAAMQAAAKSARDEATLRGYGAMNPRVTFTPDGRVQFNRGPTGIPIYPDLQFWDLTRRKLSDMAIQAGRGTDEGRRLGGLAQLLNTELDNVVPSYRAAREGAAGFFGATNALEAGQNFVGASQKYGLREARQAIAGMSETERRLFRDGYADRLSQMLEKQGESTTILNKIGNSDAAREELRIAMGQQGADELIARLRIESVMDRMRGALGGSQTSRNVAQMALAGGVAGGIDLYSTGDISQAGTTAGLVAAMRRGATMLGKHIDQRVAQRVGELLASPDPAAVRRGLAIVTNNETLMNALHAADNLTARAGAQQVQRAPQAMMGQ